MMIVLVIIQFILGMITSFIFSDDKRIIDYPNINDIQKIYIDDNSVKYKYVKKI